MAGDTGAADNGAPDGEVIIRMRVTLPHKRQYIVVFIVSRVLQVVRASGHVRCGGRGGGREHPQKMRGAASGARPSTRRRRRVAARDDAHVAFFASRPLLGLAPDLFNHCSGNNGIAYER